MAWRKLKTIILIMLLALNGALLVLVGGPRVTDYYRHNQARRDAVTFLAEKGIALAEEDIPETEKLTAQILERDLTAEAQAAKSLLGDGAEQVAVGGEVYRYDSPAGSVQFHSDGVFWAELEPGRFPVEGDGEETARKALDKLGFSAETVELEQQKAVLRQTWEGYPLFNQQATVCWDERGLTEISSARRLYGTPVPDSSRKTMTQATALINFYNGLNQMGDVCSRIDAIEPGYLSTTSLNRRMNLTPVWRIVTDTGAYQLDLVSGSLERVV